VLWRRLELLGNTEHLTLLFTGSPQEYPEAVTDRQGR
jgi:hypothetical protein